MRVTVGVATVATVAAMGVAAPTASSAMPLSSVRTVLPGPRAAGGAANWPQFHYNAAHTGYNPAETMIGPGNVGSLQLLWARDDGQGSSFSQVSVQQGRVFLGTLGDSTLRAWRAANGRLLWSTRLSDEVVHTVVPAVADGRVFVTTGGGESLAPAHCCGAPAAAGVTGRQPWPTACST